MLLNFFKADKSMIDKIVFTWNISTRLFSQVPKGLLNSASIQQRDKELVELVADHIFNTKCTDRSTKLKILYAPYVSHE